MGFRSQNLAGDDGVIIIFSKHSPLNNKLSWLGGFIESNSSSDANEIYPDGG